MAARNTGGEKCFSCPQDFAWPFFLRRARRTKKERLPTTSSLPLNVNVLSNSEEMV